MRRENVFVPYLNNEDSGKRHRQRQENRHHILPRSRGGTNDKDNIIPLYTDLHDALHRVFGNMDFREQILRLLLISDSALTTEVKKDLLNILNETDPHYYFKKGIYLPK